MSVPTAIGLTVIGAPAVVPWAAYGLSGRFPSLKFNLVSALAIYVYVVCLSYGPYVPELMRRGCFSTHYEVDFGFSISINLCHDWPIVLLDSAQFWPILAVFWLASLCILKVALIIRPSTTKGAR